MWKCGGFLARIVIFFAELDLKQRILRMGFRFVPKDFNHGDCKKTGNVFSGKQLDMSTGAKGDNAIRKAPSDHFTGEPFP